ncbi:MAG: LysR family transcriptional regulator [Nitrosomonadaceae bacterium]|nr:LysR family transcriptional regulator [Nitrosomonadaceae bacterium]
MRHSTLRQLEVFETITRLGSFTRAAEELCVTQPTVSMQIKKLTDAIGLPLFEQIGKKMYLTEAGRELHQACHGIFEHLTQFEMIAADMKGLKAGKLRLAVVTTAEYFAPRLLGMFCQQYPEIEVSLEVSNRKHILDRLANNMDDLYILDLPPENDEIIVQSFLQNPLVVLASVNHPLANKKKITLERIAEEPFIFRENGSGTRIETESFVAKQGLKLKTRMTLGSNEAIKQAILGGLGVSVLSRHTLTLDSHKDQLAILDVNGFPINCQWHYAYPSGKKLSIVAQTFLAYLQNAPQLIVDLALTGVGIITFPER